MEKTITKLKTWQERLNTNQAAYSGELAKMDEREAMYLGTDKKIKPITQEDTKRSGDYNDATHVRNIVAENIESMISSTIPQPKVTAKRKQDEKLAKIVEDMLRNELNRLPFEQMNDQQERTVPIQGGALYLTEWDNTQRTHTTVGEVVVSSVHPKQVIPQDGVFTGIEDMDYIILALPQTKKYIERKYGVSVEDEGESQPEVKASEGSSPADDMVTQYVAYYRNEDGGIGLYSWVNDTELEDLEDYQARRLKRCKECGALEQVAGTQLIKSGVGRLHPRSDVEAVPQAAIEQELLYGEHPAGVPLESEAEVEEVVTVEEGVCPYCGSKEFTQNVEDYEEIYTEIITPNGKVIPGAKLAVDDNGMPYLKPTKIPFYKPSCYPLVLQKNISVFGKFLGDSDVDKIQDQQNTVNRMEKKIIDQLIKAGTRITLPDRADIRIDPEDGEKIYIGNAADKNLIGTFDFSGNLEYPLLYLSQVYEEARQILGITDSFQGRRDSSANSGVAKQFSAAQSAGRLESKRVMKDAAYADLFRIMFQFKLAYADEPRSIVLQNDKGETEYEEFSRYDFLEIDDAGEYYWNDQFLFSVDTSAPLANNREAMWENTTAHFSAGAYGDPTQIDTLILYWTKMELLHYPGAGDTRKALQEKKQEQIMQQQMMMQAQQQMMQQQMLQRVDQQARADAMAAVQGGANANRGPMAQM